jgi:septum site-determining protein MinD
MLAVTGGKGGTGKTTTALALAVAHGTRDRPVRVVDADRDMPDLAAMAGVDPTEAPTTVAPSAEPGTVAHVPDEYAGVEIVPARPATADLDLDAHRQAAAGAPPTLVDCTAGAGPDAATPLRVADAALVVTEPTPQSLRDAAKAAAMARELDAPVRGCVVTRTDTVPEGLEDFLDAPAVWPVPDATGDPLDDPDVAAVYDRIARATLPDAR